MPFGLSNTGFTPKRFTDIRTDLIASLRAALGNISTGTTSVFGIIIAIVCNALADLWESLGATYTNYFPRTASGVSLDYAVERLGISRISATRSTVFVEVSSVPGTALPIGFQASSTVGKTLFQTSAINTAVPLCVDCVVQVDAVLIGEAYRIYMDSVLQSEHFAAPGETTTDIAAALLISYDNTAYAVTQNGNKLTISKVDRSYQTVTVSTHMTIAAVTNSVFMIALKTGALPAPAGTVTNIATPVSGVFSVYNPEDASLGKDTETDIVLRRRYFVSMRLPGKCTIDGMRASLLQQVPNITQCFVHENVGLTTDPIIGNPPGSLAVIAVGTPDPAILGQKIWDCKPAGVPTWGAYDVTVADSAGDAHVVYYSVQTMKYLWLNISLTRYTEEVLPNDYLNQIYAACLGVVQNMSLGKDVVNMKFAGAMSNIPGILSIEIWSALTELDSITHLPVIPVYPTDYNAVSVPVAASQLVGFYDETNLGAYISVTIV